MGFSKRKGPAGQVHAVRRTNQRAPSFNYELFNCNNFNIRHLSVAGMKDAARRRVKDPAEKTLFRDPKYYRWTYWMDAMYQKKLRQQNGQSRST
jgi:hypothetical protein